MGGFGQTGRSLSLSQLATMPRTATARRLLLAFIAEDTGSALFAAFGRSDRCLATPHGGNHPSGDGQAVGLLLDDQAWADRGLEPIMAEQSGIFVPGSLIDNSAAPASASEGAPGQINLVANGSAVARADVPFATTPGRLYRLTFTASGTVTCRAGSSVSGIDNMADIVVNGAQRLYVRASASTTYLRWWTNINGTRTVTGIQASLVPGHHASQPNPANAPAWYGGASPHMRFDGSDDHLTLSSLIPSAAGTMVASFRAADVGARAQSIIAGGTTGADRRTRLILSDTGQPRFVLGSNASFEGPATDLRGTDIVMAQTWGAGRRRCYLRGPDTAWVSDKAHVITQDGGGNPYRIGALETAAGEWFGGRLYGAMLRSVETSDADIRTIVLPAFMALHP